MTKLKKKEIVKWMCNHWQDEDVFDNAVNKFGMTKDIVIFCEKVAKKIEKVISTFPAYLEEKLKNKV